MANYYHTQPDDLNEQYWVFGQCQMLFGSTVLHVCHQTVRGCRFPRSEGGIELAKRHSGSDTPAGVSWNCDRGRSAANSRLSKLHSFTRQVAFIQIKNQRSSYCTEYKE